MHKQTNLQVNPLNEEATIIKRIKMDINWVIFEQGNITKPILIIPDHWLVALIESIREQNDNHNEESEK